MAVHEQWQVLSTNLRPARVSMRIESKLASRLVTAVRYTPTVMPAVLYAAGLLRRTAYEY